MRRQGGHGVEPVGALGEKQLSLVMECHGIEREDNDKHLSVLDDKKEQRAQEDRRPENGKNRETEPGGAARAKAKGAGPGCEEYGSVGGGVFGRPGADFTGAGGAGNGTGLPGEKSKAFAGPNRQGAAFLVPGLYRPKGKV